MKIRQAVGGFKNSGIWLWEDPDLKRGGFHTHFFDEIAIVLGGSAIHVIGKEKYPLIRGDVFVIHGNQAHKMLFYYEPCFRKNQKFKARLHLNPHQLNHIMHLVEQMKEEKKVLETGHERIIKNFFEILIIYLCRCYSDSNTSHSRQLFSIGKTIDYLEKNYSNEITISFLAKRLGMPKSSFTRIFRIITGCSPIDYLIKLRIEKAVEMMGENPQLRVTDVSMATGFYNSSYFTRKFKTIIGMTPLEYLKKQRGL